MTVDGTTYQVIENAVPSLRGWFVCQNGIAVAGPYRTRGEALSVAITRANAQPVPA